MAFATFSGPVRIGTVANNPGRNTGSLLLTQVYDSGDLNGLNSGVNRDATLVLPAAAQIINVQLEIYTVTAGGTITVTVGTSAGGAQYFTSGALAAGASGRQAITITAAFLTQWNTLTTADATLFIRTAATVANMTGGRYVLTIQYIQRGSTGSTNPVSA